MKASINEDLASALDPVRFARTLGTEADDWQDQVLNSQAPQIILNCCRQSGKSTIAAIMALHHAMFFPPAMVLIISHTMAQAAETFRKIIGFYHKLDVGLGRPEVSTVHRLELENGSRIITLSGQRPDSIRGYSAVTLLIVDEARQVMDESYHVARPMLVVSGGNTILLSTPHGRAGFFWDTWEHQDDWLKIRVPWENCPRLSQEEIERERKSFPGWFFRQEYECSFEEGNQSIINPEAIRKSFVQRAAKDIDFMSEAEDDEDDAD